MNPSVNPKGVLRLRHLPGNRRSASLLLALLTSLSLPLAAQQADLNRLFSLGMAAYNAKDYDKAIENLSAIVKAGPDSASENILYLLGFSYYFKLQHQEAADTFELALKKYPNSQQTHEMHLVLGRSLLQLGDDKLDAALEHLTKAAEKPEFFEEARFLAAEAFIKKGDTEKAAKLLKSAMSAKASGPSVLRATLQLVDLYIESGKLAEAQELLRDLENSPGYADVIVTVNNRFVKIGDLHLDAQTYGEALAAYSSVRPRAQVIAIQLDRLEQMRRLKEDLDKRVANAAKTKQPLPRGTEEKAATLQGMIESTDQVLGELRTMEDYDAAIQYRIGRCYFNMERYWPASVAFEVVTNDNPKSADAATSLFGAIISQWKLNRPAAARALCDSYLERFPTEKHADNVAELNATLFIQEELNDEAIAFLAPYLQKNPQTPAREKLLTLLAKARFQAGKYDEAAADYDTLRKEFPSAPDYEEFVYRRALCDFLRNDYEGTIKSFDSYEANYPNGQFRADIRYRRGIIQLALKEYDKLIASMRDLLKDSAAEGYAGQIHTLIADALAAKGDDAAAAGEYSKAVVKANGDRLVIEYALENATNLLRSGRRWTELQALWNDFLKQNPKHPMTLRGISELSKLLVRDKKLDEAKKKLADYILDEINNVRSEYVEMLLSQLAGLYQPPRSVKKDAPPPDIDAIEAELVKVLELPEDKRSAAYLARILFAKSELARMMRDPKRSDNYLNAIANSATPDDLGPILLSIIGQFLMDAGEYDKAAPLFIRLRDAFPQSPFSDAAPVGLGRIALAQKDFPKALDQFDFALNRAVGGGMMKEATFGKAQALKGLKKRDEAKVLFEAVVADKQWRGIEKAGSLYELGEIAADTGDIPAASHLFQKVYLTYAAFPEYAAKAYLRTADMLEADGQDEAAQKTLLELIKNPKFEKTDEAQKARKRIK